jgi:hypothetical protein
MHAIQKEINNQLASTTTCKSSIKTSNFQWIPLYYHILLLPDFDAKKVHSVHSDLEMKINLDIQIYCNLSTNILQLKSREFTNINLTSVFFPLLFCFL